MLMRRSGWKSLGSNECAIENLSGCGWTEKLSKLHFNLLINFHIFMQWRVENDNQNDF